MTQQEQTAENERNISNALSAHYGFRVEVTEHGDEDGRLYYETKNGGLKFWIAPQWTNINDIPLGETQVLKRI